MPTHRRKRAAPRDLRCSYRGTFPDEKAPGYAQRRERMIDALAGAMEAELDVDALLALAREARR